MKTTLVNLKTYRDTDYVFIDRRTIYGNLYRISSQCTREESIAKFVLYFANRTRTGVVFRAAVKALKVRKLACWCTPLTCHGDVIISYLEKKQ